VADLGTVRFGARTQRPLSDPWRIFGESAYCHPEGSAGGHMDIHKPKPWHGLRDFLKEYVIIVVGVLTALGAEQAVEAVHWAERTHQTEETLRDELHGAAVDTSMRLAFLPCTTAMLSRLQQAVGEGGDAWRPPFTVEGVPVTGKIVIVAPHGLWSSQAWRDAQADGTANHLPKKEALLFGDIYETMAKMKGFNEQETTDMGELNSLIAVRHMDPVSRNQYLRTISRLQQSLLGMSIMARDIEQDAKALKVKPAQPADFKHGAIPFYQEMCRQFGQGETDIGPDHLAARP
jgi:hypothetical protein